MEEKIQNERKWYDNSNIVTTVAIVVLTLIIILSQAYAVKNSLSTNEILRDLINHNTLYIIGLIYFIPLKTKTGKKYFNYFNLFLIIIYSIFSITSILSVIRSFGLITLFNACIYLIFLIFMIHIFLKKTRFWKDFKLELSPFNEIKAINYYYVQVILSLLLFTVDLINSVNVDGIIISITVVIYNILLARYIYIYQVHLDNKENKFNDLFNEIDAIDKDFPKVQRVLNDISARELNGYQIVALITMGITFCVGILFGNLFPSCGSTAGLYSSKCSMTEFNFSLTISIWFIGFLICVFFYALGNIIILLESIDQKLSKNKKNN